MFSSQSAFAGIFPDPCDGVSCGTGEECIAGFCVDIPDLCEGVTCEDTGNICTKAVCNPLSGICSLIVPDNDGVSCDDGNPCTINDSCNDIGVGLCLGEPGPIGTACGDSTDTVCIDPDSCDAFGECQNNFDPDGTPCDDGNDCRGPDECDGVGTCRAPPTFGSCDDGNDCTLFDQCESIFVSGVGTIPLGTCGGLLGPIGMACGDSTDTDCNEPACDAFGECQNNFVFGSCDDGNDCTVSDSCQGFRDPDIGNFPLGICDGDPVSGAPCNDGDGNECTGVCSTGECFPTALGDGSSCGAGGTECSNQDTCVSGTCQPNDKPDDTSCDDGELCTIGELCTDGECGMGSVNPILACMPDGGDGQSVGGKIIPIEATSLILAGTQTTVSWLIPVTVSAIGIAIVIARKFSKYEPE